MRNLATLLALATTASATIKGFNYGSTFTTGAAKQQSDFEAEFSAAQGLVGASGFTSARLYTMVQAGTANDPISAIPAAISTKTTLLLGLWASGGDTAFQNELTALKQAIQQYGTSLASLVDGISVGSEDLYRNSPTGIAAGSDVGTNPDTITDYISQVRNAISGTVLSGAQIGHVDTWTAWVNGSNSAVTAACDWIGVDAYPYFQNTMTNDISQGSNLLNDAIGQTQGAVGGKPVWVTETGWPVSGKTSGDAIPSPENAKAYWDSVGCDTLFGKVNVWWYTLQDAAPATPNPSFGLVSTLGSAPLFDLTCSAVATTTSSTTATTTTPTDKATTTSTATTLETSIIPSSVAQTTASADTGGSPGVSGLSSQISFEATATTPSTSSATGGAAASGTSTSGSGSGSGSSSGTGTSGSGSSGGGSGSSTTSSSPSATTSNSIAVGVRSGAYGAAFLAIMAAIFAL
ncbi:glycoside hydrolase superfamily [Xylariales sp. PMI_506]|nr:glycoside hydrolase superfamily [Xylariales sp. PMI_506]